jgi:hypothetical protein
MKKITAFFKGDFTLLWITVIAAVIGTFCFVSKLISDFTWLGALKSVGLGALIFVLSFLSIASCFMVKEKNTNVEEKSSKT